MTTEATPDHPKLHLQPPPGSDGTPHARPNEASNDPSHSPTRYPASPKDCLVNLPPTDEPPRNHYREKDQLAAASLSPTARFQCCGDGEGLRLVEDDPSWSAEGAEKGKNAGAGEF